VDDAERETAADVGTQIVEERSVEDRDK